MIDIELKELAEEKYRLFHSRLVPNAKILGIRMPVLRNYAKEVSKGDWRKFLETPIGEWHEEKMLRGLVLGYVKTDENEFFTRLEEFIPLIDNWAVCDSVCAGLKFFKKTPERAFDFITDYIKSEKEFEIRFGVVCAIFHFCDENHSDDVLSLLNEIKSTAYYAEMAVAWAVSAFYEKFPEKTEAWLLCCTLNDFTYNKALQKIIESRIPDIETKNRIRQMKRN